MYSYCYHFSANYSKAVTIATTSLEKVPLEVGKRLEWVKRRLLELVRISDVSGPLGRSSRSPWYSGGAVEGSRLGARGRALPRELPALAVTHTEYRL